MLILPLHHPLTRANFPIVTALLILANVFVFFILQGGDAAAMARATESYVATGLPRYEVPAYERYVREPGRERELAQLLAIPAEQRGEYVATMTQTDVLFRQRMHNGDLLADADARKKWEALREDYEAMQSKVFTLRHLLRSNEIDLRRMVTSAFLHAGVGHLVGNMLFLAVLGLLVEGALGGWRYLAVYVLGAIGSSAVSLAWRWGESGGGLGASGAIAALMGAFCVIWGRTPVRFFYWFGVVFDYTRKPAIWLLPVWLGWEVYNLFANSELNIGFDAHAGGIVTGALLGAGLVALGQVRQDFLRDAADADTDRDDRWERAQAHLGRMQLVEADALLQAIQQDTPQRFDVALARYRVATLSRSAARATRATELVRLPAPDAAGVAAQSEAVGVVGIAALSADARDTMLHRWLALHATDAVERLLHGLPADAEHANTAALWLNLGLQQQSRQDTAAFKRSLHAVIARFPASPQAGKARFLLDNA